MSSSPSAQTVEGGGFLRKYFPTVAVALGGVGAPILVRQLRADFRRNRFFVSHLASLCLLSLWLVVLMTLKVDDSNLSPTQIGRSLFSTFFSVQYLIAWIVFPAVSATAFSDERSKGSLDLLLVTTMRPAELVWGKFLASTIYSLLYIVGSIPLLAVAFLFGGVPPAEVVAAYAILIAATLLTSMIGVCVSSFSRGNIQATLLTYVVAFFAIILSHTVFDFSRLLGLGPETDGPPALAGPLIPGFGEVVLCIGAFSVVFGYLFFITVNNVRPASDDRSSAMRVLTAIALPLVFFAAAAILFEHYPGTAATLESCILLSILLFVVAWVFPTESASVSRRNRVRFAALRGPFYPLRIAAPGAFWGFVYTVVVTVVMCGLSWFAWKWAFRSEDTSAWVDHLVEQTLATLPVCVIAFAAFGFLLSACDFSPRYSRLTALFAGIIVLLLPLIFYLRRTPDAIWTFYYLSPVTLWSSLGHPERLVEELDLTLFGLANVHVAKVVYGVLAIVFLVLGVRLCRRAGHPILRFEPRPTSGAGRSVDRGGGQA